jgi:hypothetical protein
MNDLVKHDDTANADPFAIYAKTVSNQHILGKLLKFSKGDYVAGENSTPVPLGTRFVANMDSLMAGWIKWSDNRPVEHLMEPVAKGAIIPPRNTLGDTDQDAWELDENGKPRDPWQRANYILLLAEDGAIDDDRPVSDPTYGLYTFTASSVGGLEAVAKVCSSYNLDMRRQRPDHYPVIELGADSYLHRNRAFGRIKKPILNVVDWAPKSLFQKFAPDVDTAAPTNGGSVSRETLAVAAPKPAKVVTQALPQQAPKQAAAASAAHARPENAPQPAAAAAAATPRPKPRF